MKEKREILLQTEYHDQKVGAEISQDVAGEMGFVDDPELNGYLSEIGRRLVEHAPDRRFDYTFRIVDQWVPNAFALPGGHIYLSRGLLALTNSEDELANVMGHEITHAAARHSASLQARALTLNPLVIGYQRVAALARHSRDQERDADRGGQFLAAAAGFDPIGMPSLLKSIDNIERLSLGYSRLPSFFATHPTNPDRMARATQRAESLGFEGRSFSVGGRLDYLRRLEGLPVGPNPAEGIFEGSKFLHPDLGFALQFPEGWELLNTPQAVIAVSPQGDAEIALTLGGRGDEPEQVAEKFIAEEVPEMRAEVRRKQSVRLGRLPAYRLEVVAPTSEGRVAGSFTWIAFDGLVYRISSISPVRVAKRYQGRTRRVAQSFRPMTAGERQSVEVVRLRVVRAKEGEVLSELSDRHANVLGVNLLGVLNDLLPEQRLDGGFPVKIGVSELYVPAVAEEDPLGPGKGGERPVPESGEQTEGE
ncbi:M48 family metalloprotease [Myxococcota bacterium]|nr:M48 family metalloprotease [Myxococcota bacterium]